MVKDNTTDRSEQPVAERMAQAEIHITNIYEAISSLSKTTNHQHNELSAQVSEGFQQLRNSAKPDHNRSLGMAMVLLVIVGFVGNSYVRDIDRVENAVVTLTQARLDNIRNSSKIEVRVEAAERSTLLLDVTLQREMRLLGDTTNAKLHSLDTRVSKELDNRTRRFELLERARGSQERRSAASHASQAERLKALERKVYGKP